MKILDLNDLKNLTNNSVVTLGFFDGIHLGHQTILKQLVNKSKELNYKSVVITFDDDVLSMFKISNNIMDLNVKIKAFETLNIDYVLILKANHQFMNLNAKEFVNEYLEKLNTKVLVCGSDFSFACKKQGNISFIKNNTNYQVIEVDDVYLDNVKISSSYIRNLLNEGKINEANKLMLNKFTLNSQVISGKEIGRTIGFKTANLKINNPSKLLKHGVYFGYVIYNNNKYKAMVNVGYNPTVNEIKELKIEVHILSFNENIYGKNISVTFECFHREEIKFESLDDLKNQLTNDLDKLKEYK